MALRVGRDELAAEVDVADHRRRVGWDDPVAPREAEADRSFVVVAFDLVLLPIRY